MADDEQFSLCWNNFNTNLSAGFHESLCRGDLVDVSLAAEGQIVKAHRLVLSVCSPFFRKMFTQMPSNTHAIVFLNNVSHSALKDLIQFMYCGEVNVKQDALPAFISTAESLQIKGLTDNDPAPQPPQEPTPPPTAPHVQQQQQQQQQVPAQRVQRQQQRTSARYKIETVDDVLGDEKGTTQIVIQTTAAPQATIVQQQQQPQHIQAQQLQTATTTTATLVSTNKRTAQRSSLVGSGAVKRSKTTAANVIDPLESANETATTATTAQLAPQQITVQTTVVPSDAKVHQVRQQQQQQAQQQAAAQEEAEYIDLPMELPTKSEPDYSEEHAEVAGDGDTAYVEDDAYGDMRYDDSYFTENEDAGAQPAGNTTTSVAATTSKAVVKQQSQSYSDSSFVDAGAEQGNTEAQASTSATSTSNAQEAIVPRKRGRPRTKVDDALPKVKLIDKLKAATRNEAASKPAVYASTTKGGVKLRYEGHLFKFSFRKAEFSVFQCCFREHGEECKVRVVCDQKNVFPFDGEHVHFMQANDKSVTSSQFIPGDGVISVVPKPEPKVEILIEKSTTDADNVAEAGDEEEGEVFEIHEIEDAEIPELADGETTPSAVEVENFASNTANAPPAADTINPNDFREKIKRRLQKALQNKKK